MCPRGEEPRHLRLGLAFSAVGTISDRCCLRVKDYGWLSVQELISCDRSHEGCKGGMPTDVYAWSIAHGIVPETCYPYKAQQETCPTRCVDGSDWAKAHVCKCKGKVICKGVEGMKKCLQTGPISVFFNAYMDLAYYVSGIYHANKQTRRLGTHIIKCYGYSDKPEAHWLCTNSWGPTWGEKGGIRIVVNGGTDIETYDNTYCDPQ
ncbi:MAG: C1 family peptidase [Puia sp.]|nr:C1 family peptidase [Puia sp.]